MDVLVDTEPARLAVQLPIVRITRTLVEQGLTVSLVLNYLVTLLIVK